MILADALLLGVCVVLVAYLVLAVFAIRKTKDPVMATVLILTAYWTLVGAIPVLIMKRLTGGYATTYMEDKLFLIVPDGDYATALMSYAIFMLITVVGFLVLSRDPDTDPTARNSFAALSARFSHIAMVSLLVVATVPKLLIVKRLIDSSDASSLYTATRTVEGASSGLLRIYQYLNILTSYSLVCGLVLWASFKVSRAQYNRVTQVVLWVAYVALAVEVIGENGILGNRAVPLLVMAAGAMGWLRWRLVPAPRPERARLTRNFTVLAILGVFAIGVIGNSRGGGASSPALVIESMARNASKVGNVFLQIWESNEKLASHMSLYGVIKDPILVRAPLTPNSYSAYADLMQAPSDQVFTIHYVAAWWLRVGPVGVLVAALTFMLLMVVIQRFAVSAAGSLRGAFAIPAAILPTVGIPVTVLRSGPESLRAVLIELILIPGLACLFAVLVSERVRSRTVTVPTTGAVPRPITAPTGGNTMPGPATTDMNRALDANLRRWWVPVVAALVGAVLGIITSIGGGTATYQAVVSTQNLRWNDALGAVSTNATVPVDQLVRGILAPETAVRLGDAVKGSAITATPATDGSSITLRVTAPDAARAKAAADAFAKDLADTYDVAARTPLKKAVEALDANIAEGRATIAANPSANNSNLAGEIAVESLRRAQIAKLVDEPASPPIVTQLSAGNPSASTAILLAIAFGALAVVALGVLSLFDNRLRYRDDVERITGQGSVMAPASVPTAVAAVVARLAEHGPVTVVPVGQPAGDDVRKALESVGASVATPLRTGLPASVPGPVLLLAQLGTDTRSDLEVAYRAFTAVDGPYAGVLTVPAARR